MTLVWSQHQHVPGSRRAAFERRHGPLEELSFDYLKLDGEFVRHCAESTTDQLIIQAVVDIACGLGNRTVAEQVGDDETLALLRRTGVDQAQGFLLGRPAPLEQWLARLPASCEPSSSA